MSNSFDNEPVTQPYGEPVTRPDGTIVSLQITTDDFLFVYDNDDRLGFSHAEVEALGNGSFARGATRIGRAHYLAGHAALLDTNVAFQEELNQRIASGDYPSE